MAEYADFSGPPPGTDALKKAGFSGVIRYIGDGSEWKQIHRSEYEAYVRAGLDVLLVSELRTTDAWETGDDYAAGVARARRALADARAEGIPDTVPIAWAADAHATAGQVQEALQYGRGFQSVLGGRTGVYGFMEVVRAAKNAGLGSWWWVAGSKPSAADQQWVTFWQRNIGTRTVSGTVCDINDLYTYNNLEVDVLTPNDGNTIWAAYDYDAGPDENGNFPTEKWSVAQWLGFAGTRTARIMAKLDAMQATMSELVANGIDGLSKDDVLARLDASVKEATTAAVNDTVLPALKAVLNEALGEDNDEQADAIVLALSKKLAA